MKQLPGSKPITVKTSFIAFDPNPLNTIKALLGLNISDSWTEILLPLRYSLEYPIMIDKAFSPKVEYFKREGNNSQSKRDVFFRKHGPFPPSAFNLSTQIILDWFPAVLRSWACEPEHSQSQIMHSEKSKSSQCSAASFHFPHMRAHLYDQNSSAGVTVDTEHQAGKQR